MSNAIPLSEQQPFTYTVTSGAIGANGSGSAMLILGQDSDFDFYAVSAATSQDTNSNVIANNFSLLLRDVTNGRDYSTGPVQRFNLAGVMPTNIVGQPRPIRFPRKQQLEFQFTNLTANPITIQIVLTGYKVFQRGL